MKIMMTTMTKTLNNVALVALGLLVLAMPLGVFAHESHQYEINGVPYEIIIGSRGEPVIVDDKTGIDLEIVRDGVLFTGANESLQIEMIAGAERKITSIEPVYGVEGSYKNTFIATVPTTLQYRLFGTLENIPFDVMYTCNPVGHPQSEESTERIAVSEGVIETHKSGAFGCPQAKEAFGFPEAAPSLVSLKADDDPVPVVTEPNVVVVPQNHLLSLLALAVGVLAMMIAIYAIAHRNTPRV